MTMSPTVYATSSDLTGPTPPWIASADLPANVGALLRAASFLVAEACNRNPYGDVPNDTDAPVLRDATCAQVVAWNTLGVNPDTAGIDDQAQVKRSSILGGTVEYDTTSRTAARSLAARQLAPQAEAILTAAGLLWAALPLVADDAGCLDRFGLDDRLPPRFIDQGVDWPW